MHTTPTRPAPHYWTTIICLYLAGVLAAAQLGKMSALAPIISKELDLSLTVTGLLISLLEIGGALLGFVAAAAVDRIGQSKVLMVGIGLLVLAGLGQAASGGAVSLLAWRLCEGVGYLGIVIAAPILIARAAPPDQRSTAMAMWGGFVPLGFALGSVSSGFVGGWFGWRAAPLVWAGVALAVMVLLSRVQVLSLGLPQQALVSPSSPGTAQQQGRRAKKSQRNTRPNAKVWALTLAFGCYAIFAVGAIAVLPLYLVNQAGASSQFAGLITGLASFSTLAGVAGAAWWQRPRAQQPQRRQSWMITLAIALPALLLFGVFTEVPHLWRAAALAVLLNAVSGLYAGLAFALLPQVAPSESELSVANGLLLQCGASGSLLGPVLFAASASHWGWPGAAVTGLVASMLCLALMQLVGTTNKTRI
jgi:MFS transporter, CP family, cyanate transporter